MLDMLRGDGKHAVRRLVKDWQFSAGAIAILALGIGANTAVFSILNHTLFQPHPFADSERLVNLYQNDAKAGEPEGVSYHSGVWRRRGLCARAARGANRSDGGDSPPVGCTLRDSSPAYR